MRRVSAQRNKTVLSSRLNSVRQTYTGSVIVSNTSLCQYCYCRQAYK